MKKLVALCGLVAFACSLSAMDNKTALQKNAVSKLRYDMYSGPNSQVLLAALDEFKKSVFDPQYSISLYGLSKADTEPLEVLRSRGVIDKDSNKISSELRAAARSDMIKVDPAVANDFK